MEVVYTDACRHESPGLSCFAMAKKRCRFEYKLLCNMTFNPLFMATWWRKFPFPDHWTLHWKALKNGGAFGFSKSPVGSGYQGRWIINSPKQQTILVKHLLSLGPTQLIPLFIKHRLTWTHPEKRHQKKKMWFRLWGNHLDDDFHLILVGFSKMLGVMIHRNPPRWG